MNHRLLQSLGLLLGALSISCGDGEEGDQEGGLPEPVSLNFDLRINGESFECGAEYDDVGTPPAVFTATDARFFVHGVELLDEAGAAHPVALDSNAFQDDTVALLDFEDGCGPDGTAEMNTTITGTAPPGSYEAVRFTLGLPSEKNFIDLAAAVPPLDVTGMFWTWQYGYKFFKLDGSSPAESGGINPFFVHLGSSGCPGDNPQAPPSGDCSFPNRVIYRLSGSPDEKTIVADVGEILATTDLRYNTEETAPGCMSEPNDPDCAEILSRMGVDAAENQVLFATE